MRTSFGQMEGKVWEDYCQKLLRNRYPDYQEVPAQFGGDYGIDGLTRSGLVFQCYCPDEDSTGIELYEHQRDKITRDIAKLIKNATPISALGVGIIKEWHFVTPKFNHRDLLSHCRTKECEVKSRNIPEIDKEFKIYIKTEDDYIQERQLFLGTTGYRVQPSVINPHTTELEKLLNSDNQIVMNIKNKLKKLKLPPNLRESLTRELVSGFVAGKNELETLNKKFPSAYSSIIHLKSATESQLMIKALSWPDPIGSLLPGILNEYEEKLKDDFSKSLSSALITKLSTEAISDWLGRCPLDFPDIEDPDALS